MRRYSRWSFRVLMIGLTLIMSIAGVVQKGLATSSITGFFEVSHGDDFVRDAAYFYYDIHTLDGRRIPLHFSGSAPEVPPGTFVQVSGTLGSSGVDVADASAQLFPASLPANIKPRNAIFTPGAKKIAAILIDWANNPLNGSITTSGVASAVFTGTPSVNSYIRQASLGTTSLTGNLSATGDVFGPFRIAVSNASCNPSQWVNGQEQEGDYDKWADAANAAAEAANSNFNPANYDSVIYVFPPMAVCAWAGLEETQWSVSCTYQSSCSPTVTKREWINQSWSNGAPISTISHEVGHSFGLNHASTYRCYDANNNPVSISNTCQRDEYGDPFDVMGNEGTGNLPHYSAFHDAEANFIGSANEQTISQSGVYTLNTIDQAAPNGVQLIRIPRGTDSESTFPAGTQTVTRYYYLEYRRPYGTKPFASSDPVANGVTIRLATDYSYEYTVTQGGYTYDYGTYPYDLQTWLIDTTPGTASFADASLAVNNTFTDPNAATGSGTGLCIKTLSTSSTSATVSIGVGTTTCPTVAGASSIGVRQGFNFLSLPTANYTGAKALADAVASAVGAQVRSLVVYENGRFQVYIPSFSSDFALSPGQGVILNSAIGGTWTPAGTPYSSSQPDNLTPGWNLAGIAYSSGGVSASTIASHAGACSLQVIAYWDGSRYTTWQPGNADTTIPPGAVWLQCQHSQSGWTP